MSELFAKSGPEWTQLILHLKQVAIAAQRFANYLGSDEKIAHNGALMHDIGKAHPFFQGRLRGKSNTNTVFRHEIASLFFLSVFPKEQWHPLIEMVVGHHKSVRKDIGEKGLLDLEECYDYVDFHVGNWEIWSTDAINILVELGLPYKVISKKEAIQNLEYCINFCKMETKKCGYSTWRGLLMGADYFASSMIDKTEIQINRTFKKPNLNFYNRQHPLYSLSFVSASSEKSHTIVVASTGSGKTDYLFRRCKGRIFYTLPFQASINAMYKRVGNDLEKDNPDLDIRVLHSTSSIVKRKENEETALQSLIGSSVKILTPHQLAAIVFGMKGFESLILDIRGCDVILDEIHTYSGVSQALVLKLIEMLKSIDCKIHVGTATMPTILYKKIIDILGHDVIEIKLSDEQLDDYDRHIVHKLDSFEEAKQIIGLSVHNNEKILLVLNKVKTAQDVFEYINEVFPNIPSLLLHSRYKRGDRNIKERQLMGLDDRGRDIGEFNTSERACIVVATQIVEVSLDISFNMMITETAPLDAMIQRFGRINRKRSIKTIGQYKNVYVIAPPDNIVNARPYDVDTLIRSYEVLEDNTLLRERGLQAKIDEVFTRIDFLDIEEHTVFKSNGKITIDRLTHNGKAILFQLLDIDSASCILESDQEEYENGDFEMRLALEIQVQHYVVSKMAQSKKGNKPFIIPDASYSFDTGLDISKIKEANFNISNRFL